ncbi:M12 family metallopeptidase [Dyadobacter diqingensis]|uniref:M12 family metallopeptidase n=1 Tax=Dyadobacter diqingensis TaxID=2938121 RepID=UPI0020C1AA88|nr:M12 family metallopeptidase [Dyadobacter diqingensis]
MLKLQAFWCSFVVCLVLVLLTVSCTSKNNSDSQEKTSEIVAKDSIPPHVRLCTELIPDSYIDKVEGLSAGVLSATRWRWAPGKSKVITVTFIDGVQSIQKRVQNIASAWEPLIGAKFMYVPNSQNADIKISFAQKGVSWSSIGTDSKNRRPSMNFGWLEEEEIDSLFQSVVLHEFGHAIGLVHEHQLPNGNKIKWNVDSVYAYYMGYPNFWKIKDIKLNIFDRYSQNQIIGGKYDPLSIMMYHIPASLTEDGYTTPINVRISKEDKRTITDVYLR